MPSKTTILLAAAAAAPLLAPAVPAPAQSTDRGAARSETTEDAHEKGPIQPPGVPALPDPTAPRRAPVMLGPFASVQVNVDVKGANIPGDAANEPSLVVDPTAPNRMAIGWRQFDTVQSSFRQAGNAWSDDGGRTWHVNPVLTPGTFRSDPVLDADAQGVFYYNSLIIDPGYLCQVFRSEDGGRTWTGPIDAFGGDKQWMVIDRTDGIGQGSIYCHWSANVGCCQDRIFTRSFDLGFSWFEPVTVVGNPRWGACTVAPDGALVIAGRAASQHAPVVRVPNANDPNADPQFQLASVFVGGNTSSFGGVSPQGLHGQMWIDVDRSDGPRHGWLYLVGSVDPPGSPLGDDPQDLMFCRSSDGGATWTDPLPLIDDGLAESWQWFGTMSVAPNGRIDVVCLDTVDDPTATFSVLKFTSSDDGGDTWSAPIALGPAFDHFLGYPQQQKMGDYFHMRSDRVGADLAYAATYNGEQDVWFVRIGDRDCNGNGIGDGEDLASGAAADCNANGIPDACEIAAGAVEDADGDGVPDACASCIADLDADGVVGFADLVALLAAWGPCDGCAADLDASGDVGLADLLVLLSAWGDCP